MFNLQRDLLAPSQETKMLDGKENIIATSERDRKEKTGFITVKENGITLPKKTQRNRIKSVPLGKTVFLIGYYYYQNLFPLLGAFT